jgi:hypothetical protein
VIAGEDKDLDLVEPWRAQALPEAEPLDHFLQPPQASRRLGQPRLAFGDLCGSAGIAPGQIEAGRTQFGE